MKNEVKEMILTTCENFYECQKNLNKKVLNKTEEIKNNKLTPREIQDYIEEQGKIAEQLSLNRDMFCKTICDYIEQGEK